MAEKLAKDDREAKNIGPIEAYNILLQRNVNGDRLLSERTSRFLAASSILFLAFVMLLNPNLAPVFKWLRIVLPVVGGFVTFLFRSSALQSSNALEFYWGAQENIERKAPEFAYMREKGIAPWKDGKEFREGRKQWKESKDGILVPEPIKNCGWLKKPYLISGLSKCWLPLIFGLLWIASLIIACLS